MLFLAAGFVVRVWTAYSMVVAGPSAADDRHVRQPPCIAQPRADANPSTQHSLVLDHRYARAPTERPVIFSESARASCFVVRDGAVQKLSMEWHHGQWLTSAVIKVQRLQPGLLHAQAQLQADPVVWSPAGVHDHRQCTPELRQTLPGHPSGLPKAGAGSFPSDVHMPVQQLCVISISASVSAHHKC